MHLQISQKKLGSILRWAQCEQKVHVVHEETNLTTLKAPVVESRLSCWTSLSRQASVEFRRSCSVADTDTNGEGRDENVLCV